MSPSAPVQIDLVRVRDMATGCGFSLTELHEFYAPRAQREMDELTAAVERGEHDAATRVAHGAAGSSASLGMVSLAALYRALHAALRDAPGRDVHAELAALALHLDQALAELARLGRDAASGRDET